MSKLDPEESICVHYWQIGDVFHMAEEMDEKVTNDEAQEILEEIEDSIDSEITTKFILLFILFLTSLSSKKDLDEVNFWRPTGNAPLATLSPGEPLFFKLKKDYGNMIVGFGPQIAPYAQINHHSLPDLNHEIGCILLTSPIFFPEEMWIQGPND